jgi:hypothetical protein
MLFQILITLVLGFFFRDHVTFIADRVRKNKIQGVKPDSSAATASAHCYTCCVVFNLILSA